MTNYDANLFQFHDLTNGIPVFLILAMIVHYLRRSMYSNVPYSGHFVIGYYLRIAVCLFNGWLTQFFYNGGDYIGYYERLLTCLYKWDSGFSLADIMQFENTTNSIAQIGFFISLFTGNSIQAVSFVVVFFAFLGSWHLYLTFLKFYPKHSKAALIATMYVPSAVFWAHGGLMKDPVAFGAMGFLAYSLTNVLISKNKILSNLILAGICGWLLTISKPYILISILPAFAIFLLLKKTASIKKKSLKIITRISIISLFLIVCVGAYLSMGAAEGSSVEKFSAENILEETQKQQDGYRYLDGGGSFVDLGAFDPTPMGMLKSFPKAINLSLFRPYIFEARKPIIMISALESTTLLILTIMAIFRNGIVGIFKRLSKSPFLLFCLIFALLFAGFVGISTFNFGTLGRYKIPCLPFYAFTVLILLTKTAPVKKRLT